MSDVLEDILALRRERVKAAKKKISFQELDRAVKTVVPVRGFQKALTARSTVAVIAEMKRESPSAGLIRHPFVVTEIAAAYEKGGASAISVLTESDRFNGSIEDLRMVRAATTLPILEKDFVFDPYQIVEARVAGADAVLLIADMLGAQQLNELVECAFSFGLDPLVEVFTAESVEPSLRTRATLIGINTRNLRTLKMTPENISILSKRIPSNRVIVAESGIKTADEIRAIVPLRARAVLVGESLLKQADLASAVKLLTGVAL